MATVLAFHAHPDDEVLMTGGTLARVAAEGHRVVIVVATDGLMGPAAEGESPRMGELRASAAVLGAARVVHLGYADSGNGKVLYPDPPDRARFVRADPEEAAERLAAILKEENTDVLLSYDANGGYGHRDHVRVHEVGRRAAALAGVHQVLEATLPRDLIARALKLVDRLRIPCATTLSPPAPPTARARPSRTRSTHAASPAKSNEHSPHTDPRYRVPVDWPRS